METNVNLDYHIIDSVALFFKSMNEWGLVPLVAFFLIILLIKENRNSKDSKKIYELLIQIVNENTKSNSELTHALEVSRDDMMKFLTQTSHKIDEIALSQSVVQNDLKMLLYSCKGFMPKTKGGFNGSCE